MKRPKPREALLALACAVAPVAPAAAADQEAPAPTAGWTVRTRAVMSGSSTHSDPAGYKVYSGIGVEAAVSQLLSRRLAVELTMRTESRERDVALSSALVLNLDARWNLLRTDLSEGGARVATLKIDPLTLGVGIGVRL